ncbi:hypothetical protein BC827DRAFT_1168484 [Russula dissimulans]|nr:hypothetical protein BC827DRAFT_1168484 [Russula dissimulans]
MSCPMSQTLLNASQSIERPSIKLKISRGRSNIDNSIIVDAAGQTLFSIKSNSRRTVLASCKNNVEIAKVKWNRVSPCMVFRGKKMTCEEWLPLARPDSESRLLTQGDAQFAWVDRSTSGYLIPANRPGLAVARWNIKSDSDELTLQIFQEALVESGLLERQLASRIQGSSAL